MSAATLQTLGTIGAAILALLGVWLSTRQQGNRGRADDAQSLFNEVQEERAELKKERTELKSEVAELKAQLELLQADVRKRDVRDLVRDEFVQELRNHIRSGKPPPPPDWPEMLRNG